MNSWWAKPCPDVLWGMELRDSLISFPLHVFRGDRYSPEAQRVHFSPVALYWPTPSSACLPQKRVHPICSRNIHVPISWFWMQFQVFLSQNIFLQTSSHRNNKTMDLHGFHVKSSFLGSFCCLDTTSHMPVCLCTQFSPFLQWLPPTLFAP